MSVFKNQISTFKIFVVPGTESFCDWIRICIVFEDPYQSSVWIRIRIEFFKILDPDSY